MGGDMEIEASSGPAQFRGCTDEAPDRPTLKSTKSVPYFRSITAIAVIFAASFFGPAVYAASSDSSPRPTPSWDYTRLPTGCHCRIVVLDGAFRRARESARDIIDRPLGDTEYLLLSFDTAGAVAQHRIIEKQTVLRVGPTLAENRITLSENAQFGVVLSTAVRRIDGAATPRSRFTIIGRDLANIHSFPLVGRHGQAIVTNNGVVAVEDVVGESTTLHVAWVTGETVSLDVMDHAKQFMISPNGAFAAVLVRPRGDTGLVPPTLRFASTDQQVLWDMRIPATDTMLTLRIVTVTDEGKVELEGTILTRPPTKRTVYIDRSGRILP